MEGVESIHNPQQVPSSEEWKLMYGGDAYKAISLIILTPQWVLSVSPYLYFRPPFLVNVITVCVLRLLFDHIFNFKLFESFIRHSSKKFTDFSKIFILKIGFMQVWPKTSNRKPSRRIKANCKLVLQSSVTNRCYWCISSTLIPGWLIFEKGQT